MVEGLLRVLRDEPQLSTIFFRRDDSAFSLDGFCGLSDSAVERVSAAEVWPTGDELDVLASIAAKRGPVYLANTEREMGLRLFAPVVHAAYLLPLNVRTELRGVFVFLIAGEDSIDEPLRRALEVVVTYASVAQTREERFRDRLQGAEDACGRFITEMTRLGFGGDVEAAVSLSTLDFGVMTPREQEVLHIFIKHGEISAIADRLSISPHTVRNHLKAIYRKLGVHSQAELLRKIQFDAPAMSG